MALRARLALLLAAALIILALASGLLLRRVFLQSFLELETALARRQAEWLSSLVSGRLTALSSSVFDYAVRDETWEFIGTRNPAFLHANISGEMFSELGVDGVLFLDTAGVEVFSSAYDPSSGMQHAFPASLGERIESDLVPLLLSGDGAESGLLAAGSSAWLVASCPILRSGGVGPRVGTLLFARLIDEDFLGDLSMGSGMEISLELAPPLPGEWEEASCRHGALLLSRDSPDTLEARLELADLAGSPLTLGFAMARELFATGRRNAETALLILASTGVLFALVTVVLFDLTVVRRLGALLERIRSIGQSGDTAGRVGLEGEDEFADLSRTMDEAFDRLKRTAEEARTSRLTFDRFMRHIPGYAFITDCSGRLVYANERLRREMLAGREDWAGLGYEDVWPPEVAAALEEDGDAVKSSSMPVSREIAYRGPDGGNRTLSCFRFPLGGRDSREMLTGGICFDMTERVRARQELARAEKRSMALYEAVPDTIFIIGRDGFVRGFHGGVGGRLAVPPEQVVGTWIGSIGMPDDDLAAAMACIARSLDTGSVEAFEYRIIGGPSRGWFECRMAPLEADSVICTVRDVTARKQMEADMLRAQKEESISLMAGGIAHDFNNILTAIGGSLELAAAEPLDAAAATALRNAGLAVEKATMITRRLLTLAKAGETGSVARLDMGRVLRETLRIVLDGSSVEWRLETDRDLQPVEADEGQMIQVVSNLVVNARDAMDGRGSLLVRAWMEYEQGRPFVKITFEDTGPGVPEELAERLFDPYFTTKPDGTGLGLAVSRSIVRRFGGALELLRHGSGGAAFVVSIPASAGRTSSV